MRTYGENSEQENSPYTLFKKGIIQMSCQITPSVSTFVPKKLRTNYLRQRVDSILNKH